MDRWGEVERAALVALLRHVSTRREQLDLVQRLSEGGSVLELLREHVAPEDLLSDPAEGALEEARLEIESWEQEGIRVLTMGDDHYPYRLRDVFDRPPLLFARGSVVENDQGVAVVGSRAVSDRGATIAAELATRLVECDLTVVSGLAAGVDAAAHHAAIRAGGRTVGIIGTGVRKIYPPQNRELHREVVDHGAIFSQFWPDQDPDKKTFPLRNGTMSGYALATIIVEANERSGTRIQARKAVEHGRPVVMMRSVVERTNWGSATAARPDAYVANDVNEAMTIVDDIVNRPEQIEHLIASLS